MYKSSNTLAVEALLEEAYEARIQVTKLWASHATVEEINQQTEKGNRALRELKKYGTFVNEWHLKALKDPRPEVRLISALWGANSGAVQIAVPVLIELAKGKFKGKVSLEALTTLRGLKRRGLIGFSP